MAKTFRLLNTATWAVEVFAIGHAPPYLAVSHAWSDRIFPRQLPLAPSFGSDAIRETILQRGLPQVRHCWVDLFCIIQDSDQDMCEQIPLMGHIYGDAAAVLVILTSTLDLTQAQIDHGTARLGGALAVWRDETWADDAVRRYWARGPGRALLVRAMDVLARFTHAAWGTRVWTLQEYLLAANLVWIGADLRPVSVSDELFAAVPRLCEELAIAECARRGDPATSRYELLFSHFSGMAARRTGAIDRTRVMELLGNREAFLPVDEVYGSMAVSTVEISVRLEESRESAWKRWTEAALAAGHLRWLMVPPAMAAAGDGAAAQTCEQVMCSKRHELSSASGLDTVTPYGPVAVSDGTVSLTARPIGSCKILRPLGPVHRGSNGWVHRDLTLILFANGNWFSAIDIAVAFGAGRYTNKQLLMIAQALVSNYDRAVRFVKKNAETRFCLLFQSVRYVRIWADFMQLQSQSVMDTLNFGFGYLVQVRCAASAPFLTVMVTNGRRPEGELVAFDCNACGGDRRHSLLIGEKPAVDTQKQRGGPDITWHKAGVTVSVGEVYSHGWDSVPLVEISVGGSRCQVCRQVFDAPSASHAQVRAQSLGKNGSKAMGRRLRKGRRDDARRRRIKRAVQSRQRRPRLIQQCYLLFK
ncbi:Heterokaryon incompatibility [Cordyceps javanica]|uniref:Heterokaryon incompatibility n=1 Tax=Cordyceps javanica TaxID=43265 RepID=A0A545URR1_9HYPO|nr:Heterokaryon incompatibility [Cordyceps javanica]TQW04058.1 Heterokaryon incompatibility [Cordyceps javanica]